MEKEQGASPGAPLNPSAAHTTNIRAIETSYRGYRFRSRLEARWAVFYDAMQIEWQYEPEGFELPSGRYLPDFFLPALNVWVEIKGSKPTARESRLACEMGHFAMGRDGGRYRMFVGDIPRHGVFAHTAPKPPDGIVTISLDCPAIMPALPVLQPRPSFVTIAQKDFEPGWDPDSGEPPAPISNERLAETPAEFWSLCPTLWGIGWAGPKEIQDALDEARSARFEHGETGRRK